MATIRSEIKVYCAKLKSAKTIIFLLLIEAD
jgi:hypothetical protein